MLGNKDALANIAVRNLDVARKFYEGILGLEHYEIKRRAPVLCKARPRGADERCVYPIAKEPSQMNILRYTSLRRGSLAAVLALVLSAASAFAGDFYEKDGVALKGYDPVAYFTEKKPVKGSGAYKAEYGQSVFHFASQSNRDAFVANPARYAPQYGGFCAFGTAGGYKAAIDPAAFTVVNDKLYLNYNKQVQRKWSADVPGFITQADRNWPEVRKQTKIIE